MRRTWLLLAPLLALRALALPPGAGFVADGAIEGLRTPTDVAFRPDGSLAVADPSARSVAVYGPDGALRWTWSSGDGAAPLGLAVDGDSTWVVGRGRLVRLDAAGTASVDLPLPDGLRATDVALAGPGELWISAAPDDHVLRVDRSGVELQRIRLDGPRGLASDGDGGVWVTEAAGGGLVHLGPTGATVGTAGGWGLAAGQFLAPRGITRAADGGWVVADSRQGIAVALAADGAFAHTVSGGDGALQFAHPVGIDAAGDRLAVADAAAGRVVLLRAGGPSKDDGRWPAEQWLFRPSTTRDADPSTTCRQCHDGTRSDALGVWDPAAHAHPTDVGLDAALPPSIPIAEDGSLRCVSCHSMHTLDPSENHDPQILRGAELAAVSAGPVRGTCLSCHADRWRGGEASREAGHPLGVEAPAGSGLETPDGRIGCATCHAAHGAPFDAMTVRRIDDGTLCLACHADHGPSRSHHPIGEPATAAAVAFIGELGGRLGPGDTLTCLSCHDPHGVGDRHLLRAQGTQSACTGCHDQRVDGGHADRACAACHGMHTSPTPTGDPRGCPSCHETTTAHPLEQRGCAECHDPHDPAPAACASCHEELGAALAGGPHDASAVPVRGSTDPCGSCHRPHEEAGPYLIDAGVGNPAVGRCRSCHDGSTRAQEITRWVHPPALLVVTGADSPFQGPDGEPAAAGRLGAVTCATCHDSHAPGRRRDVVGTCAGCHGDEARALFDAYHERAGSTP